LFKKILIANRGEIALRIIRACRELGITSAAVYSEADRYSLHKIFADEAYNIGKSQSSSSYLNKEKIIDLAKKIKADAIHPGYGFLSENYEFIKAVEDEGIVFIGPSSESVMMMGNKTEARRLMRQNNVPIVPGTVEAINNVQEGIRICKETGFPVLLKASAGGGGKGMRKVSSEQEFEEAFEAAARESLKAFGSDKIYMEKYLDKPRHIEVQVLADKYGSYVHLFERECSIQRRHQKIIEEAPSFFIGQTVRERITSAAINAAKACSYHNAGTVEFLMDDKKNFYFLEMNTRLQVEHPVTELITGIDLVKEQIAVAAGNKLSFNQNDIKINGHAIESRIYAEDAENNFLPSTGKIIEYQQPSGPGIRLDNGFRTGSEISVYYDPLIAKLITHGENRETAVSKMKRALEEYHIAGVITNIPFLLKMISDDNFRKGSFDIGFAEREFIPEMKKSSGLTEQQLTAAALISAVIKSESLSGKVQSGERIINTNRWLDLLNDE